jgi:hypothetical protein
LKISSIPNAKALNPAMQFDIQLGFVDQLFRPGFLHVDVRRVAFAWFARRHGSKNERG